MSGESTPLKEVVYGSIAGALSKLYEHPFDLVKVRLQSQSPTEPLRFTGPLDCFKQTITKEGASGLYRGVSMPVAGAMAENATLFLVYNRVQSLIGSLNKSPDDTTKPQLSFGQLGIAAGCAGAAVSFVLTPIELVKCRMQVQRLAHPLQQAKQPSVNPVDSSSSNKILTNSSTSSTTISSPSAASQTSPYTSTAASAKKLPGPISIIADTLKTEGPRGLWLGQTGTLLREIGGGAAWFLTFEFVSDIFLQRRKKQLQTQNILRSDLPAWQLMLAGAASGVAYNVVLYPADSIKSTIQTEKELGRVVQQRSFVQVGLDIYRGRGFRGLYSGCFMTCLRSGPGSALVFLIYSMCERYFG